MTTFTAADYWLAQLLLANDNTGYLFWQFHTDEQLHPLLLDYVWQIGFAFDPELYQQFMVCEDYTFADIESRFLPLAPILPVHPVMPSDDWRRVGWDYARIWRNASTVIKWQDIETCAVQPQEFLTRLFRHMVLEIRPFSPKAYGRIDPLWRYKRGVYGRDSGSTGLENYMKDVIQAPLARTQIPKDKVSKMMPNEWRWVSWAMKVGDYLAPMYIVSRIIALCRRNLMTIDIEDEQGFCIMKEVTP